MNNEIIIEDSYGDELSALAQGTWSLSPTAQKRPYMPEWFDDIVSRRGVGMLSLLFYANYPWVVFPEFIPGFSTVAFHKKPEKKRPIKPKRLQIRYFQGIEALDYDMLIQKSVSVLCRKSLKKSQGMLKLEDDNLITFIFPSYLLTDVLRSLGMPKEEIFKRKYINEENIDWESIGL